MKLPLQSILILLATVFLVFQVWIFLSPKLRNCTREELAAIHDLSREILLTETFKNKANAGRSIGVTHFRNDPNNQVTEIVKNTIRSESILKLKEPSAFKAFVEDLFNSITKATSFEEVLQAGQKVNLDLSRHLKTKCKPCMLDTAHCVFGKTSRGVRTIPFVYRALLGLLLVATLPWAAPALTAWARKKKSNSMSFLLIYSIFQYPFFSVQFSSDLIFPTCMEHLRQ